MIFRSNRAYQDAAKAEANAKAEAERLARLELEKNFAPRIIPRISKGGETNIDPLRLFAGVNVIIECLPDAEPKRLADNITTILDAAGWHIVRANTKEDVEDPFQAGVRVESASLSQRDASTFAAQALLAFLTVSNINAASWPRSPSVKDVPENTVRIFISLRPDPYLQRKAMNDWTEKTEKNEKLKAQLKESREETERQNRARAERYWEELWQEWRKRKAPPK